MRYHNPYICYISVSSLNYHHLHTCSLSAFSTTKILGLRKWPELAPGLRLYPDQRSPWPWVEQKSTPARWQDESRNIDGWWLVLNTSTLIWLQFEAPKKNKQQKNSKKNNILKFLMVASTVVSFKTGRLVEDAFFGWKKNWICNHYASCYKTRYLGVFYNQKGFTMGIQSWNPITSP